MPQNFHIEVFCRSAGQEIKPTFTEHEDHQLAGFEVLMAVSMKGRGDRGNGGHPKKTARNNKERRRG
jgi:hypothetical protein